VIADITLLNENVMYEVGYAHGRGLTHSAADPMPGHTGTGVS
jgi:hypothetical protein